MNKAVRLSLIIVLMIVSILIGLFLNIYLVMAIIRSAAYGESMKLREYVCTIPEIGSGYTPQGIGYSAENDLYVMTGYAKDNESVMYIVKDDVPTRVYLADENGDAVKGHAGGVTCEKDYVYLANGNGLRIYKLSDLVAANGTERVKSIGVKPVAVGAAYVHSDGLNLYVGEFYRSGNYETNPAHHYTTPNGETNKAIITCYPLNADGSIYGDIPIYAVSVPDLVQGAVVKNGKYILSRSYGLKNSKLDYYGTPVYTKSTVTLDFPSSEELGKADVPLYYLDETVLEKRITLPAFSEDITIKDDRVIVTNESACNKYIVGKLFGGNKVYSYPLEF